jgi:hypothetical protein
METARLTMWRIPAIPRVTMVAGRGLAFCQLKPMSRGKNSRMTRRE